MGESSFSAVAPPVFDGDNYQMWAARMETYLEALDLWEAIEEDYEVPSLSANPTVAQIKLQKEKKTRKSKAKACLFVAISQMIFMRIMSLKTAKKIWNYLKAEYEEDERIRGMKALNLIRDFELQKIKKSESVKEYSDRLLSIANKVRLLGSVLNDSRIVEKLLVTVLEKFEATITTLENTKDLSKISLTELLNALQAQEQKRSMRQEGVIEGALLVKHQDSRSGCTNHMTYDKKSFEELRDTEVKRVRIGNGEHLEVKGKGSVAITSYEGKIFALNPTAFIPRMQSKKLVEELTIIDEDMSPCRTCNFGKQHRQPFPKQAWRASKKLQLVHTDLCGPQRTPSLDVAGVFWKFKAKVENEGACLIQTVRSDNGKEYTSETFNRFCEEAGIEHNLTTPYTPQQNGVSVRRNRFIMEMTRCMLHEKDLPKRFWGKAANTIMCLQNRISTKVVKDPTPFEVWYGYKPSLKFVRVFGCLCFIYIPQVKCDKLDKKSEVGIFVGMLEESKDERQDALVDDAPVRGGAFSDF
ncbi:uncharacterized protein LOC111436393 [Cucurbita moschata]|uniref:Uncharacterized protein LOC111436393 n=1 Tax=Cucurbita moschata TaxID=3662 RepID=A0A6J1EP08_CUCMO|nr:uncharacterized protein LOC111436393 [Cucurbita moschata]